MPVPRLARKFEMGLSSAVGKSSSMFVGPAAKKAVRTF